MARNRYLRYRRFGWTVCEESAKANKIICRALRARTSRVEGVNAAEIIQRIQLNRKPGVVQLVERISKRFTVLKVLASLPFRTASLLGISRDVHLTLIYDKKLKSISSIEKVETSGGERLGRPVMSGGLVMPYNKSLRERRKAINERIKKEGNRRSCEACP